MKLSELIFMIQLPFPADPSGQPKLCGGIFDHGAVFFNELPSKICKRVVF